MAWDDLGRQASEENKRDRDRLISVWIGVLAVILAICAMGGSNATKEATLKNIEASNAWNFFQAKNHRREMFRIETDQLEFQLAANPQMPDAARVAISDKVKALKQKVAELTSDPKSGEGLEEISKKAKSLEAERNDAMKRDPYFDYGQALIQIGIVLASVAIISEGVVLLGISGLLGLVGTFFTINGFWLLVQLPFIN